MPSNTTVRDDLGFVRDVVNRADHRAFPPSIAYLWAAISLVGFSLIDFAPERVGLFWTIAGPIGFLLSGLLGWRHARESGQESTQDGKAHALHWGALLGAIFMLYPLIAAGALRGEAITQVILLIISLVYFLAGVHLAPSLKWAALAMAAGYVITLTVDAFAWTALGVLFAVGLVISARAAGDSRGARRA